MAETLKHPPPVEITVQLQVEVVLLRLALIEQVVQVLLPILLGQQQLQLVLVATMQVEEVVLQVWEVLGLVVV